MPTNPASIIWLRESRVEILKRHPRVFERALNSAPRKPMSAAMTTERADETSR